MLYLFSPPKRIDDEESYIFTVLDRLNERFELGQLLRLSYWVERDKRLFVAVFERGRVGGEFGPGGVGAARMKAGPAEKAAGAKGKVVRIRTYRDRGETMVRSRELPRMIDAVHAALHEFEAGGLDRLNSFLGRANFSGFTREDVERVLEAIAQNSVEDDAESKEAKKLQDALGRGGLTKKGGGLDAYMEVGKR